MSSILRSYLAENTRDHHCRGEETSRAREEERTADKAYFPVREVLAVFYLVLFGITSATIGLRSWARTSFRLPFTKRRDVVFLLVLGFEEESTDNLLHVKWGAQPFFTRETTEVKNAFEEWLVGDEKSDRLARLERGITRLLRLLFAYCVPNGDTRLVNWALRHRTTAFVLMSALAYILGTMIPAFIISFFTNVYFLPGHLGPFLYMYGRLQCAALMC